MSVFRGLAATLAVAATLFVAVGARNSDAVAARCFTGAESIGLSPTGAVTLDGLSLVRSTTTGRFQADGGIDFDTTTGQVDAVEPPGQACSKVATTLQLTVSDPFTGVTSTVPAVAP